MELGAALAAVVAAALHSRRQLVRPTEGADKQGHQNGHQRLGLLEDVPTVEVGATGLLRGHDLVRFLDQRGDEPQGNGHHHGQLVNGDMDLFQGVQQGFQSIRQADGAGGIGHQECPHHQQHDADDHEQRVFNTLHGDPEDAPLPEVVGVRGEEHIENACERDDEHQRLQAPHQRPQAHMGHLHAHGQRYRHDSVAHPALGAEQRNDVQRHQQDFRPGVQLMGAGISREILA